LLKPFWEAVCDDFNMPVALAAVWNLLRDGGVSAEEKRHAIQKADAVLGLDLLVQDAGGSFEKNIDEGDIRVKLIARSDPGDQVIRRIAALIRERNIAKMTKNFMKADEIRHQLKDMGVGTKDLPGAVTECTLQ
jgi:cysteinyl-tRNA synthetase